MAKNIIKIKGVKHICLGVTTMPLEKWEKLQQENAEAKAKAEEKGKEETEKKN